MNSGIYALASGMTARWKKQDSHATNISGASAIGQKRLITSFSSFQKALESAQKPNAQSTSVTTKDASFDWSPGRLKQTGESLDFAIEGQGFFQIQTPNGVALSRDGHFQLNSANQLVTTQGFPVLGESGPITLQSRDVKIRDDGSITSNGLPAGKLKMVMPERLGQLSSDDGTYFATNGAKLIPSKNTKIIQGVLEESNVELPREMVGMIHNQRMTDMLARAVQTQDDSFGRAIQELGTIQ